ncbi:hypothetical protein ACU4GD_21415 [Cupriavidus basilensis]
MIGGQPPRHAARAFPGRRRRGPGAPRRTGQAPVGLAQGAEASAAFRRAGTRRRQAWTSRTGSLRGRGPQLGPGPTGADGRAWLSWAARPARNPSPVLVAQTAGVL